MVETANRVRSVRGTKRRCLACHKPFYDLGRPSIDCPMCGERLAPGAAIAEPVRAWRDQPGPGVKAGWRSGSPRPKPVAAPDAEIAREFDEVGVPSAAAETPEIDEDGLDDSVLETDVDDDDVSQLITDGSDPDETAG
ncbi:MAG: FYDLN acid domain-containing protein [Hyphomicrobiaceae bacterium]|nr:FYDLN acid domain-containing protein [Hyphomicrobiaceae bacterium]